MVTLLSMWSRACWHAVRLCTFIGVNTTFLSNESPEEHVNEIASGRIETILEDLTCDGYSFVYRMICRGMCWGLGHARAASPAPQLLWLWIGYHPPEDSSFWWFAGALWRLFVWVVDVFGTYALGVYSAAIKEGVMLMMAIFLCILLLWGLDLLLRPLVWMSGLTRIVRVRLCPRRADPPEPLARDSLAWRGPEAPEPPDNDFYRDEIRGRNARRQQNHLLAVVHGVTVRLDRGPQRAKPANRHGLKFHFGAVVSCNGGQLRRELADLEDEDKRIHLCRQAPCEEVGVAHHALAYTAVDADSIVDLQDARWKSPLLGCCTWLGTMLYNANLFLWGGMI